MTKKLWQASFKEKKNSNLFAFENYLSKQFNNNISLSLDPFFFILLIALEARKHQVADSASKYNVLTEPNFVNQSIHFIFHFYFDLHFCIHLQKSLKNHHFKISF